MAACKNLRMTDCLMLNIHRSTTFLRAKYLCVHTTGPTFDDMPIKSVKDIPGPHVVPFLGTAYRLLFTNKPFSKQSLQLQLQDFQRYGLLVKNSLPGFYVINVYDPSDAEKVLRSEPRYPKRFNSPLFDYFHQTRKSKPGVFFQEGEEWYKHRSVISKRLLRPKELDDYVPVLNDIISDFVSRLRCNRGNHGLEDEIPDLDKEIFKWAFESVAHVLFDKRFHALGDRPDPHAVSFIEAVRKFTEASFESSFVPVWFNKYIYETKAFKCFIENFDKMYSYAELFIEQKMKELEEQGRLHSDASEERAGFLKFLLSSKELTKDDLLASVIDLLFGGVDTTSNTMQWALYMMGKNTDKQQLLHEEVRSVLPNGEQATMESLSRMPYLKAWVKETLRLYPALAVLPRILDEDLVISNYNIPSGSQVNIMLYAMGRNGSFFKEANRFKPERWIRKNESENRFNKTFSGFASLPFGFGARMCLGRRLAEMELQLLIARIVQEFHIQYPHPEDIHPAARGTLTPDHAVRVKFVDREMEHQ